MHLLRSLHALVLLALITAVATPEGRAASLNLGSGSAAPGQTALVPVTIAVDAGAVAAQFDVTFDPTRVSPGFPATEIPTSGHLVASSVPVPGVLRVAVYSLENRALTPGALLQLPFRVAAGATQGASSLTVSNVVLATLAGTPLPNVTSAPGSVDIRTTGGLRLQLTSLGADGSVRISMNGQPGVTYHLERSSNLRSWQRVATAVGNSGGVSFTDPGPAVAPSFYRAVAP